MTEPEGCTWPGEEPLYIDYHDTEWGVPERDSGALFEKLSLEAFQAGLSWITILRKRDSFRMAFDGFDPHRVAAYGQHDIERLLRDPGIVRHRGKIEATIGNAKAWQRIETEGGFSRFLWAYTGGKPIVNRFHTKDQVPAKTQLSTQISKDLKAAGFKFCGPKIVYAFMQASGIVNDHLVGCPRHTSVQSS